MEGRQTYPPFFLRVYLKDYSTTLIFLLGGKMNKKVLKFLAIFLSFVMIMASCGGDDDSSSSDSSSEASSSEASSAAEEEAPAEEEAEEEAPEPEPVEERTASDVGITEDSIKIGVIVSDLQGLIDIGYPLPAALTTDHLSERFTKYFDEWNAAGGINGRMIEGVQLSLIHI